jgi:hypothetical protein
MLADEGAGGQVQDGRLDVLQILGCKCHVTGLTRLFWGKGYFWFILVPLGVSLVLLGVFWVDRVLGAAESVRKSISFLH